MDKKRQELIDNYKAEQRALKTRKALNKTRDWGENIAALLLVSSMALVVIMICVTVWNLGLGFIIIAAGVVLAAVVVWLVVDNWSENELEKARQRRYKELREED